ncbi:uncharacterized protein LOC110456959 [Mizuhopecten yessoensis]|uniref:uncharacterized protein LOC110456959 n=1 Tax=Mizuhopecten yessoensis TaxID=6573 RepID=UPI000B4591C9|nr:uncharacterized protein LOC110456959 [Mizuhopecten yessoensis]
MNTLFCQSVPPEIDSLEYNQGYANVTEHGSKTLICKVESVPSSTITWYFKSNDTKLFTATDVLESSYTLTTAGCLDTGLYTCSARNSVSNTAVTKNIRINVLCSPRLDPRVFTVRQIWLATHDNLTMNAMFLSNPEPSSFTWTFQNSSHTYFTELNDGTDNFVIHNTPFSSNLSALSVGTRANIQEAWFGLYNVTATNSKGNGTLTFTVADKGNPSPPNILQVDCGKQMSAEVSWEDGGNSQFYRVLFSLDAFKKSKEVYPVTIAFEDGRNIYSLYVDNLVGGRLYTIKIAAYNTYGNTTSLDAVGCTVQGECSCGTDNMNVTGVALICTGVLTLLLTVGLGIFISRNGRLPFIKGQHLKQREFQNVQLSERAVTPNKEEDERSPYEQLDTNKITKASVYSEIGSHLPGRRKDSVNDNREYESLEGRSNPNVYEELHGTPSGDKEIYINTAIAEGCFGSGN